MMKYATTKPEVKIGQIFSMSWGYDQTNVNYFQVTRISKSGVFVREIGSRTVEGSEGFMSCQVKPAKDAFLSKSQWCGGYDDKNPETFRRLKFGWGKNNEPYFNFRGRYFAHAVSEDSETYNSWYA